VEFVLILTAVIVLATWAQRLPAQNFLAVVFLLILISSAAETLNIFTGFPFGPTVAPQKYNFKIFHVLPWSLPLTWIISILGSRDWAGELLQRIRQNEYYGLWLIGLASLFSAIFWFAIEAADIWGLPFSPWKFLLGKFGVSLLIFVAMVPWLIKKGPA